MRTLDLGLLVPDDTIQRFRLITGQVRREYDLMVWKTMLSMRAVEEKAGRSMTLIVFAYSRQINKLLDAAFIQYCLGTYPRPL